MGRAKKMTKARKAEFVERVRQVPYFTVCAKAVDASVNTVRNAMRGDEKFAEEVREARAYALDRVAMNVHKAVVTNEASFDQQLRYLQSVHPAFKKQELDLNLRMKQKGKRNVIR